MNSFRRCRPVYGVEPNWEIWSFAGIVVGWGGGGGCYFVAFVVLLRVVVVVYLEYWVSLEL
jgi:hypothetical protein